MKNKNQSVIIGSDMNATTEMANGRTYFGKHGSNSSPSEKSNDNGKRLETFTCQNNLCLLSSFFERDITHRYTWFSNDGKTRKILDHILCSQDIQKRMINCKVRIDQDFQSDHRAVSAAFKTNSSSPKYYQISTVIQPSSQQTNHLQALTNENVLKSYINKVEDYLEAQRDVQGRDVASTIENNLTSAMEKAASTVLPKKPKYPQYKHEIFKEYPVINRIIEERC